MELHLAIELAERRTICLAATHGVEIELDRNVGVQGSKLARL